MAGRPAGSYKVSSDEILEALKIYKGNIRLAAVSLGVSRRVIDYRIRKDEHFKGAVKLIQYHNGQQEPEPQAAEYGEDTGF